MELSHSLLLNEEACSQLSLNKRPIFVFEWLRFLDKVLLAAHRSDIKESQKTLVEQLLKQMRDSPGPPTRRLLARCLANLFSVGDTFDLMPTINVCNDIIKNKDDSPSALPMKLSAVAAIGEMYERLGRMVGRSYEDTVVILLKAFKNAESQGRGEILMTFQKVVRGLGSIGSSCYKDIYKVSKQGLSDRSMLVRCAAAQCLYELVEHSMPVIIVDFENMTAACFRSFYGSNYDVRRSVGKLIGHLFSTAMNYKVTGTKTKIKQITFIDASNLLTNSFLKGAVGFLKGTAGDLMKGNNSSINREVRVGVTHAYVEFVRAMGGQWLERNIKEFLQQVFCLVGSSKSIMTHVDIVYARKCVLFILRSSIGALLAEKAQANAAKELCRVIIQNMNACSESALDGADSRSSNEFSSNQQVIVCAMHELCCIVQNLGTFSTHLIADTDFGITEPVVSALVHPAVSVRLSAAWCLRSIGVALPSTITPLTERCMKQLQLLKSSPEAVSGYSCALSALLAGARHCPLGIPHGIARSAFQLSEELLRTASQNSRMSFQRTQAGWQVLGALMTLGTPAIRAHLPKLLLLWRNAFPRSSKELESEKNRGDSFTWQVTLESRAGALATMQSFITHCGELITEDVIRRLLPPIERALAMLPHLNSIIKIHGGQMKAGCAMVRLRLYDVLYLLPPDNYENAYNTLLRELVAEFTLTDNPSNTTTSLLRSLCHVDDSVVLGSWLEDTDYKSIEDQLQPNSASGSGAIEHDISSLFLDRFDEDSVIPGPLPLGVAVINSSVLLYGKIFPMVPYKHRVQMLEHFAECIKQAKAARQQAVQVNVFTAVLCALKSLAVGKVGFGQQDVQRAALNLVLGAVGSPNPILRCAAGEALGRMSQVVGDHRFIAEMAQFSFDKLKSARDAVTRTGHSLALGCLHRYVGGMGSGHHLNTSVGVLLALANDANCQVVQVWALHALGLIADSGGPMFRDYVEPTLSLVLTLSLTVSPSYVDVCQALGKCLSALITTIGPDLQGNSGSASTTRLSCLICCAVMQDHTDSLVRAEAIACLQRLHLFAPKHVNLSTLVPHLCMNLESNHLVVRRAVVSCLRQLSHREAAEVSAIALKSEPDDTNSKRSLIPGSGIEPALFRSLDTETDKLLTSQICDTMNSLLLSLGTSDTKRWLGLLRGVLTATETTTESPADKSAAAIDAAQGEDESNDDESFTAAEVDVKEQTIAPKWPTKVFAMECLLKLCQVCESDPLHYDIAQAMEKKKENESSDYLILHLSELIRMGFMAATSDSDKLRLIGLSMIQEIIGRFSNIPEPEFPGHVILEQYQAQITAALRPAFNLETSPDVTAEACVVCSSWISSGVARDLNDLRRVHQLLVTSLAKFDSCVEQNRLYCESTTTMERLALLKAWAEVYTVAAKEEEETRDCKPDEYGNQTESLSVLVRPHLETLGKHWLNALRDYSLLSLPSEFSAQLPKDGGFFYYPDSVESSRPFYKKSWAPMALACALWLRECGFVTPHRSSEPTLPANMIPDQEICNKFYLLCGVCVDALCTSVSDVGDDVLATALEALYVLLSTEWPRSKLASCPRMTVEIMHILHRCLLTRDFSDLQFLISRVVHQIVVGFIDRVKSERVDQTVGLGADKNDDEKSENVESSEADIPELVNSVIEIIFCIFVKRKWVDTSIKDVRKFQCDTSQVGFSNANIRVVRSVAETMVILPELCTPVQAFDILPTCFQMLCSLLEKFSQESAVLDTAVESVGALCSLDLFSEELSVEWVHLLKVTFSALFKEHESSEAVTSRLLSVCFLNCPRSVLIKLRHQLLDVLDRLWRHGGSEARQRVLDVAVKLAPLHKSVTLPFYRLTTPLVIEHLHSVTLSDDSDIDLALAVKCIDAVTAVIETVSEESRVRLTSIYIPLLVHFLGNLRSPSLRKMHEHALANLLAIGRRYPNEFKSIMSAYPHLGVKLHSAVQSLTQKKTAASTNSSSHSQTTSNEPAIKLKMDFSNFQKA